MSSDEEKKILNMVEAGKISAEEAMKLIKALEEAPVEDEIEIIEPEDTKRRPELARPGKADTVPQAVSQWERAGVEGRFADHTSVASTTDFAGAHRPSSGPGREGASDVEFEQVKSRARRFTMIPLGVGFTLTVLASYWLFVLVQNANYGFWFACAWFPLLLGILILALSAGGVSARWLYVNVDQRPGEWPQHITFGFPIPLGWLGWLLRTFGPFVPGMDRQRVEEIMTLLATADAHGPLIVNVEEGERGERVQVYIG